jgi:hypothetical protein
MVHTLQLDRGVTGGFRRAEWHRPPGRPASTLVGGCGDVRPAVSRAPHPLVRRRFVGGVSLLLTGVLSGAVVAGLIAIAHLRAVEPVPAVDPVTTVIGPPGIPAQ